jgi:hypothetical protein
LSRSDLGRGLTRGRVATATLVGVRNAAGTLVDQDFSIRVDC